MSDFWSDEVRIMLHPMAAYRELARSSDNSQPWLLVRRPLFVVLVIGSFAAFTVAGQLTLPLLLDSMIFWSFGPLLQALLISGIVFVFARNRISIARAIDLFFMGHGPWLLWLLAVAGTCVFFPLKQFYLWPVEWGWILPVSLLGAWVWSNVTSFGFLKGALNFSTIRASAALLVYTIMLWGVILSYLFAVESFQLHRLRF